MIARSQRAWQDFFIDSPLVPDRAQRIFERREARRRLRLIEAMESVANRAENATTDRLRAALAIRYRNVVGVELHDRERIRRELKELAEVGRASESSDGRNESGGKRGVRRRRR